MLEHLVGECGFSREEKDSPNSKQEAEFDGGNRGLWRAVTDRGVGSVF